MNTRIRIALAAGAALTAVVLTGCAPAAPDHSSMPGMPTPSATSPLANDADAMFASMMIAHHQQAIDMSDLVLGKDGVDPAVSALATRIKQAQAPEIEQLKGWLDDWGVAASDAGGMGHGDGMMSADDMAALEAASGADAGPLFLTQMIVHHEGAVDMARTELADGKNADARALAQAVVDVQTAEIAEMKALLG